MCNVLQADVLVNSIASQTGDLSEAGAISKAFFIAGGTELQRVTTNEFIVTGLFKH